VLLLGAGVFGGAFGLELRKNSLQSHPRMSYANAFSYETELITERHALGADREVVIWIGSCGAKLSGPVARA